MTVEPSELLDRLASTLRSEIGPEVGDEYARTQAYMAAVILEKVSRELALGPAQAEAERVDMEALHPRLAGQLALAPVEVTDALAAVESTGRVSALGPLIDALYRWTDGGATVDDALATIRPVLRRDIDRRMEIAR